MQTIMYKNITIPIFLKFMINIFLIIIKLQTKKVFAQITLRKVYLIRIIFNSLTINQLIGLYCC